MPRRPLKLRIQRPLEEDWMNTVFDFCTGYGRGIYPALRWTFHCPNENSFRGRTGKFINPGYPDIGLDVSRGGFHGLRIEMKRDKDSVVRPEQIEWIRGLRSNGYAAFVCRNAQSAIDLLIDYCEGKIIRGVAAMPEAM
jgi:hypothetical protein